MKADGCCSRLAVEGCDWEAGGGCGESTAVAVFRFKLLGCTGVVDADAADGTI